MRAFCRDSSARFLFPRKCCKSCAPKLPRTLSGSGSRVPLEWLEIRATTAPPDRTLSHLGQGERQAIQLAEELSAELLLVDEKAARREAAKRNLRTTGTLGILDLAADKGLVDFAQAFERLKETSFYISSSVENFFLERDSRRKRKTPSP